MTSRLDAIEQDWRDVCDPDTGTTHALDVLDLVAVARAAREFPCEEDRDAMERWWYEAMRPALDPLLAEESA